MTVRPAISDNGETEDLDALFDDPAQLARIRNEARFGLNEMSGILDSLPDGARVVEVGSGTGYLLAVLARRHPRLRFEGIEPIGAGFQQFERILGRIAAATPDLTIHRTGIEEFSSPGPGGADCIFSINVFEHLRDWRSGLDRAVGLLSDRGCVVVLCPNYAVPYEPHFGIPILGTSGLTRRVFAAQIERIEKAAQAPGLWDSLNFISVPALARHARRQGYHLSFDRAIMARMLERLDDDPEFAARQTGVASVARRARQFGVGRLLAHAPAIASPYMKATITAG